MSGLKRDLCAQCKSFNEGHADPNDGNYYCNACWAVFSNGSSAAESVKKIKNKKSVPNVLLSSLLESENIASENQEEHKRSNDSRINNKSYDNKNKNNDLFLGSNAPPDFFRLAGLLSVCRTVTYSSSCHKKTQQCMASPLDILEQSLEEMRQHENNTTPSSEMVSSKMMKDLCFSSSSPSSSYKTILNRVMKPCFQLSSSPCLVNDRLSPTRSTGTRAGYRKTGASSMPSKLIENTNNMHVNMKMRLMSIEELVAVLQANFDEDVIKIVIEALDKVIRIQRKGNLNLAQIEGTQDLLDILGTEHYELIRCIAERARDVLIKLLQMYCAPEELMNEGGEGDMEVAYSGGNCSNALSPGYGPTMRIICEKDRKLKNGDNNNRMNKSLGFRSDEMWFQSKQKRYKQLTEETELEKVMRSCVDGGGMTSLTKGSSMSVNAVVTEADDHIRISLPAPQVCQLPLDRINIAKELPQWTHPSFFNINTLNNNINNNEKCTKNSHDSRNITHLNALQTVVFDAAFHSDQNMLICAPTGAGKTLVALLFMLRCIQKQLINGKLNKDFKIVYIAPMKALAQEIVVNFSRRLASFLIVVKELTGDMQLTKKEIAEAQILVTTPEKWDVVTRKSDNEYVKRVKLIIIDEIHLLNDSRGPVIEAIVARTLRDEEQRRSDEEYQMRVVALSATLPNYEDVARFLNVDLDTGLKVFGQEYRPVPLEQAFIAPTNKALRDGCINTSDKHTTNGAGGDVKKTVDRRPIPKEVIFEKMLDELCVKEVIVNLQQGNQVMVFVHARMRTHKLADYLVTEIQRSGKVQFESLPPHVNKRVLSLKGKGLSQLLMGGRVSCHHAGLPRYDRTSIEDMFRDGDIRVLCCTSTLAWGVNLPAHTVIIRGTEFYDPEKGGMQPLSSLDVMQIFGRAGRPQYDTSGLGVIISSTEHVQMYVRLLSNALPIESQLQKKLCDHLNAEIHMGNSVNSIADGVRWLEYTYLWQRIRSNPWRYGLKFVDVRKDPKLSKARYEIIDDAAKKLAEAGMVRYSCVSGSLDKTDIGRVASFYYIDHNTIKTFNEMLMQQLEGGTWLTNIGINKAFEVIGSASEFTQLRIRKEEQSELEKLEMQLPARVRNLGVKINSGDNGATVKVPLLLKAYISHVPIDSHSLACDMNYIVQNAPRLARGFCEIEMYRSHSKNASTFLSIAKSLDKRCWEFEHPIFQMGGDFPDNVRERLSMVRPSMSTLAEMTAKEVGDLVRNQRIGRDIADMARRFPEVEINTALQPITATILRLKVTLTPKFLWDSKIHGGSQLFWLFVEDEHGNFIFHQEQVILKKMDVIDGIPIVLNLTIPIIPEYNGYNVSLISDSWLNCGDEHQFSVAHLHLPDDNSPSTKLLPMNPLTRYVIPEHFHSIYQNFTQFNAIQTQVFHALYHTDENVFLGAPTGSGKTICCEFAVLRTLMKYPGSKIVYVAPLKALVKERLNDWGARFGKKLGYKVIELSGDATPDISALANAIILCCTPEKWDGISRNWQVRSYVRSVKLVIFDEVHMLGTDRGPILEVIVSRMRYIGWHRNSPIRLMGLSTAVANPGDIGAWLGITKRWAMFNFEPSVRPVPMQVYISGYQGIHYCPRMTSMNMPCYSAILEKSPNKPVIIFVSSRRQTRLTAFALIDFLNMSSEPYRFVRIFPEDTQRMIVNVEDPNVKHCAQFGIGLHHAGLSQGDKKVVEDGFRQSKLQILVATSTLAWGVNFPAHMVIVKGTEFYDAKTKGYIDFPISDLLQMIGRAGRPQFDNEGIAQVLCLESKKSFYRKFLYDRFPVESALTEKLHVHINAEVVAGTIKTLQDAVDYLTWTFLLRRLVRNPSYYGVEEPTPQVLMVYLSKLVAAVIGDLQKAQCVKCYDADGISTSQDEAVEADVVQSTVLGKICSYYYLNHLTVHLFDSAMRHDSDHKTLLKLLVDAKEFDELPVRHNEDKQNIELSQFVPFKIGILEAGNPHIKAFLLFQAHFGRVAFPVQDYNTDKHTVLDNSVRIIQAMVDIAANRGYLHSTLRCISLLQCVVQARWWHENTLLQIPHMTPETVMKFKELFGISHLSQLAGVPNSVMDAIEAKLLRESQFIISEEGIQEALLFIKHIPVIDVALRLRQINTTSHNCGIQNNSNKNPSHDDEDTEKKEGNPSYELLVNLTRISSPSKYVIAPEFHKCKDEQFWVLLGNEKTCELVAMKRLTRLHQTATVTLAFEYNPEWNEMSPRIGGGHQVGVQEGQPQQCLQQQLKLNLYLMSDSYIGMDQQYEIVLPVKRKEMEVLRI